jgi:hypothetical protein
MGDLTYLLNYVPLCFVTMLVLELCGEGTAREILRRALRNFVTLTVVFAAAGAVIFALHALL